MLEPFFFKHQGSRLFAICHRPEAPAAPIGVVFCHPFGEEKQFSHRVLARFARELERARIPALRFDGLGYGDSDGDESQSTVEGRVAEILAASRVARERLGVERVVLLGLRFGATLAALAAEQDPDCAGLILWNPVTVGADYADELIRKKLLAQLLDQGPRSSRDEILKILEVEGSIEIEGSLLTHRVVEEMRAIDLYSQVSTFRENVLITAIENRRGGYNAFEALVDAYQKAGADCRLIVSDSKTYWDDRCMNVWYFPEELFGGTIEWIGTRWVKS